jgi:hypothetical protein
LSEKLQETRDKIIPRKKFSFKQPLHKNNSAISLNDAAELAQAQRLRPPVAVRAADSSTESSFAPTPADLRTPPGEQEIGTLGELPSFPNTKNYNEEMGRTPGGPIRKPSFSQASNVVISDHTGLHIVLPLSAGHATSSGSLTKLSRCIVDMSLPTAHGAAFAGLMLQKIQGSLVIVGQVDGAAHITGITNSVVVVSARQVRMHDCKNVDVYLLCASRPIIEDCSNVRFAPIPDCYVRCLPYYFFLTLFENID